MKANKTNYVLGGSFDTGMMRATRFSVCYDTEEELMKEVEKEKKGDMKKYVNLFYKINNKKTYLKKSEI